MTPAPTHDSLWPLRGKSRTGRLVAPRGRWSGARPCRRAAGGQGPRGPRRTACGRRWLARGWRGPAHGVVADAGGTRRPGGAAEAGDGVGGGAAHPPAAGVPRPARAGDFPRRGAGAGDAGLSPRLPVLRVHYGMLPDVTSSHALTARWSGHTSRGPVAPGARPAARSAAAAPSPGRPYAADRSGGRTAGTRDAAIATSAAVGRSPAGGEASCFAVCYDEDTWCTPGPGPPGPAGDLFTRWHRGVSGPCTRLSAVLPTVRSLHLAQVSRGELMTRTAYYTATTLDGFLADEHDSLDWLLPPSTSTSRGGWPTGRSSRRIGAAVMGRRPTSGCAPPPRDRGEEWPYACRRGCYPPRPPGPWRAPTSGSPAVERAARAPRDGRGGRRRGPVGRRRRRSRRPVAEAGLLDEVCVSARPGDARRRAGRCCPGRSTCACSRWRATATSPV